MKLTRHSKNPILSPTEQGWQKEGTFNGTPVKMNGDVNLLFRALSKEKEHKGKKMKLSTIGKAKSKDGINFDEREKFIEPKYIWDAYGCEDPRVTKIDDEYFISYTALSLYPFKPEGVKIAVATSENLKTIKERKLATTFNSKAMVFFPERIKGKILAFLTVHTDKPPAKIAYAKFDHKEQIWSPEYWKNWIRRLNEKIVPLLRNKEDHLEIGAAPVKTKYGWLLIYSYIKDYFSSPKFGIEATLLDSKNPMKIKGRTKEPILEPKKEYEMNGQVKNVVFPSGALKKKDKIFVYYGGADTRCCVAHGKIKELINNIKKERKFWSFPFKKKETEKKSSFVRFKNNPLLEPRPEFDWESKAVFNPAAVCLDGKVHLVYRAMSKDNTSTLGYAQSKDGIHIDERSSLPIYTPRKEFEKKKSPGNSGCEDPRITKIKDKLHMTYTAFDGKNPTRVALSTIKVEDFLNQEWNWSEPKLISPPGTDDKNSCIIREKTNNHYVIFHRIYPCIWIDFVQELDFSDKWIKGRAVIKPRTNKWDSRKVGIAAPPIETKYGLLLLYHASGKDKKYRVGAVLLESENPTQVIARTEKPLLEPKKDYEIHGQVKNVVFPCGAVLNNDELLIYYGGADKVVAGARIKMKKIFEQLKEK